MVSPFILPDLLEYIRVYSSSSVCLYKQFYGPFPAESMTLGVFKSALSYSLET